MAPWSFTTFSTSESTSIQPPGKPLQTLEQIIIRQLSREQRNRTRGQVPQESCGIVATSNQPKQSIAGRFKIRNILEDEVWKSFKGNQSRKPWPESRSSIPPPQGKQMCPNPTPPSTCVSRSGWWVWPSSLGFTRLLTFGRPAGPGTPDSRITCRI